MHQTISKKIQKIISALLQTISEYIQKATPPMIRLAEGRNMSEPRSFRSLLCAPFSWFRVLAKEMHWSFVYAVVAVNGISQGLGGAAGRVATDYYWKDVQRVMPSEAQVYQGIISLPWIVKPFWGLLTDVLPVAGYRRRPYFILAGILGAASMLTLWLQKEPSVMLALLLLSAGSAGLTIADVTIDACIAQNSISHQSLAADMQSLCGLNSSVGSLLGFGISGLLMHAFSPQEVLGLLSIPFVLVCSVGMILKELRIRNFAYQQVHIKVSEANSTIWARLRCPQVWRSCIFMYVSFSLSLNIQEGLFYWYTDKKSGPSFSQGTISSIHSFGSLGSLLGVLLYQYCLKDYPFRTLLFWAHLLSGIYGMLDIVLVLRLNLSVGVPDRLFKTAEECVSQMIGRVRWMPFLVLSSKLCPPGIEGTFFALLMAIDHAGMLTSSWAGGLLLDLLKVTRTDFGKLWVVILIRNLLRVVPLVMLNLVPVSEDQRSMILPTNVTMKKEAMEPNERTPLLGNNQTLVS